MSDTVTVDVVSDVVCPWCFVGKRRLDAALATLPDIDVEVRWRPFQLDPTIPPEGKDRRAYMIGKFGSEDRIRQIHANIVQLGAVEGISFDFDAIKVAPNTLDAHRVVRWAAGSGADVQNRLVGILFSAYFEQGQNIGDHSVLLEAAQLSGMDVPVVEALLPSDADRDAVQTEIATASRMGISGVPCFLLDNKYAVMGAQDTRVLADAIRQVAAEHADAKVNTQ
ncbi:MAG: DsbA family protein [Rhizobiaceae bacterium]|nr:DsbA family protein [Rhizobiaceae bacterium]